MTIKVIIVKGLIKPAENTNKLESLSVSLRNQNKPSQAEIESTAIDKNGTFKFELNDHGRTRGYAG